MRFKNVSPLGDLDIPAVGIVLAGEEFEISAEIAPHIAGQASNFVPVDDAAREAASAALAALDGEPTPEPPAEAVDAPVDTPDAPARGKGNR
ncbi:MAG: hypothetical protein IE935_09480 [Micrococcales bacterium]|nr:hypothetical protein [Micrococcales bacterium]